MMGESVAMPTVREEVEALKRAGGYWTAAASRWTGTSSLPWLHRDFHLA